MFVIMWLYLIDVMCCIVVMVFGSVFGGFFGVVILLI